MSPRQPDQDERLWSGYTCETCGWFELRPQTRDRGRLYCPHCERLGRGKAFTMKQINVVPAAERDRYRSVVEQIGQMVGAKANGTDARAVAKLAREALQGA